MAELEWENVIKVMRALLQSTPSDGLFLEQLLAEYKKWEGCPIPYRELGLDSVDELIRQSGEFVLKNTPIGTKIIQKDSTDSVHIKRFVREKTFRQPRRSPAANHFALKIRSAVPTVLSPHPSNCQNLQNGQKTQPQNADGSIGNFQSVDAPSATSTPFAPRNTNQIVQAKQFHNNAIGNNFNDLILEPKESSNAGRISRISLTDQTSGNNSKPDVEVAHRPDVSQSLPSIIKKTKLNVHRKGLDLLAPTEALAKFCNRKEYESPSYKCFFTRKTRKFQCVVNVNKEVYSTYPEEFNTEEEARNGAARMAFLRLKELENAPKYEVCLDSSMELAFKIRECICSPQGVFRTKIPELFQKMHRLTLPDKWYDVINDYPELFSVEDGIGDQIIYEARNSNPVPVVISGSTLAIAQKNQEKPTHDKPDKLSLPWHKIHWSVFITNPVSTVEVWARLIGPEYSGKMDALLANIDRAVPRAAEMVHVGQIYMVMISECWCRVRIECAEEGRVWCFFIDFGDKDWFSYDEIYICDRHFMRFPAQAIRFTLSGLEDFTENPIARQLLHGLADKSLIAETLTKQDEFAINDSIKAILYDTSSDEKDVQLNQWILEQVHVTIEAPQLQWTGCNKVNVSYVSDAGDIYCNLTQSKNGLKRINELIRQLTDGTPDLARYGIGDNVMSRLYLIYNKCDDRWYRATILPSNFNGAAIQCFCIDYGWTKMIEREHIYLLDLWDPVLSAYPAQTILVRLHEITAFNENVIQRLRGLMNTKSPVTVEVIDGSHIPMVDVYKQIESTEAVYKINDFIRMEQELLIASELMLDSNDSFDSTS